LKLELKPYLQPFERELAFRELSALLDPEDVVTEDHGYHVLQTNKPEGLFQKRLTYWQRVGKESLAPSLQTSLEYTQNGFEKIEGQQRLHSNRRLRYGPHDLHEYRGKFFPQLVRALMTISEIPDGGIVLDPMCGSGTTPCEVIASGRSALGADLNPLSVLISSVKSGVVLRKPTSFLDTTMKHLSAFRFDRVPVVDMWPTEELVYLKRWFAEEAIEDLASVMHQIRLIKNRFYRDFFLVCLSNIIRSVSWQKDTDLRIRKEIKPYHQGLAVCRFKEEVARQVDRIYPYLCLITRLKKSPNILLKEGNSVVINELFPEYQGCVDLLITSPPYATALPYLDTDRLSLIVLKLLPRKRLQYKESLMIGTREVSERQRRNEWEIYLTRKKELPRIVSRLIDEIAEVYHCEGVGFRRRNTPALLGKYYVNMLDAMRSARVLMRTGARGYYVVGNNSTRVSNQRIEIPTDTFLYEIGLVAGWQQEETINMELIPSRDIYRENRGSKETILCFRA
jgi:site-specific DNA-methyltransferase (cytosine-N4-specific)